MAETTGEAVAGERSAPATSAPAASAPAASAHRAGVPADGWARRAASVPADAGLVAVSREEAHVRFPHGTRTTRARVLGMLALADGRVAIYLDRLIHRAEQRSVGGYAVSGGRTTILTGPAPTAEGAA